MSEYVQALNKTTGTWTVYHVKTGASVECENKQPGIDEIEPYDEPVEHPAFHDPLESMR